MGAAVSCLSFVVHLHILTPSDDRGRAALSINLGSTCQTRVAPVVTKQVAKRRLTIAGAGRDAQAVVRRGRSGTVCARGADQTASRGRSASPLGGQEPQHSGVCPMLRQSPL